MSTPRTIMLQRVGIKFYGYDWELEPMFEDLDNEKLIVGWYLKFIAYADKTTNYRNVEITTSRVVEADLDRGDGTYMFRTRSGSYYQMYKINQNFAQTKWDDGSDLELRKQIVSGELIAYAKAFDIVNRHANRNNFIDYVRQVKYNIIEKTEEQLDMEDEKANIKELEKKTFSKKNIF